MKHVYTYSRGSDVVFNIVTLDYSPRPWYRKLFDFIAYRI